jgi:tetrahydromethanopterin S-methyltransferase subunit G
MAKTDIDAKREYRATLLRLNARAWGMAVGVVFGIGLLLATLLLIIEGGKDVGPHLALLGKLLPGYRVTVGGAFIGFAYMFVIGYAVGRVIGIVYNFLARGE